jgi:phage baseplate assembly protein W
MVTTIRKVTTMTDNLVDQVRRAARAARKQGLHDVSPATPVGRRFLTREKYAAEVRSILDDVSGVAVWPATGEGYWFDYWVERHYGCSLEALVDRVDKALARYDTERHRHESLKAFMRRVVPPVRSAS